MLSIYGDEHPVVSAIRAGAQGYIGADRRRSTRTQRHSLYPLFNPNLTQRRHSDVPWPVPVNLNATDNRTEIKFPRSATYFGVLFARSCRSARSTL